MQAKRELTKDAAQVHDLLLILLTMMGAWDLAWDQCQNSKARALSDSIGLASVQPQRIMRAIAGDCRSQRLLAEESDLVKALQAADLAAYRKLTEQLAKVHKAMDALGEEFQPMAEYRAYKSGEAAVLCLCQQL